MVNSGCEIMSEEQKIVYFEIQVIRGVKRAAIALGFSRKDKFHHGYPGMDDM